MSFEPTSRPQPVVDPGIFKGWARLLGENLETNSDLTSAEWGVMIFVIQEPHQQRREPDALRIDRTM
ncbi:hypothetical protein N7478_011237 [Penicillium angulare]|uniref:uncharacterized protein n=1 Tax=Penicillium angulare TaxID=116970 RepID=UPI0025420E41|nr:uncharacterized protein N7478_011237 [Penicillium angulare]KAJ5263632.1 hypothetical protein N7478_011237 [Penicillium angulare]